MTPADIDALVVELLRRIAPDADPTTLAPDEDMRDALEIDSMDFMRLVVGMSEATGRDVPERDMGKLVTMAGMRAFFAD